MNFDLTDTSRAWESRALALGRELAPDAPAAHVIAAAAPRGLLDPDADLIAVAVAVDAVAQGSAAAAIAIALHSVVLRACASHPSRAALAHGERVGALALVTERPAAGRATLTGKVSWVAPLTPGGIAVVGGTHEDETLAHAVDLDAAGVEAIPTETAALDGVLCGSLTLTGAPAVPLGPTRPVMATARILLAAAGLGMGRRALREALQVARGYNRTGAGGEQTVQGLLADAATELDAATLLTWKAASARALSLADASMAKLAATEGTQHAVARATQVVGGDSFKAGHILERLARDVRALELFGGRTETLREAAAEELFGGTGRR